jgi:hypothetical protein
MASGKLGAVHDEGGSMRFELKWVKGITQCIALASSFWLISTGHSFAEVICNQRSALSNIRSGPGAKDHSVVASVPNNTTVRIIERVPNLEAKRDWYKVEFKSGGSSPAQIGFIDSIAVAAQCETQAPPTPTRAAVQDPPRSNDAAFQAIFTSKPRFEEYLSTINMTQIARTRVVAGIRLGQKMPEISSTVLKYDSSYSCPGIERKSYIFEYEPNMTDTKKYSIKYKNKIVINTYNDIVGRIIFRIAPVARMITRATTMDQLEEMAAQQSKYIEPLKMRYGNPLKIYNEQGSVSGAIGGSLRHRDGVSSVYFDYTSDGIYNSRNFGNSLNSDAYLASHRDNEDILVINFNSSIRDTIDKINSCAEERSAQWWRDVFATPSGSSVQNSNRSDRGTWRCNAENKAFFFAPHGYSNGFHTRAEAASRALEECNSRTSRRDCFIKSCSQ